MEYPYPSSIIREAESYNPAPCIHLYEVGRPVAVIAHVGPNPIHKGFLIHLAQKSPLKYTVTDCLNMHLPFIGLL